jgi:integrase
LAALIPIYLKARTGSLRDSSYNATKKYLERGDYWKPLHDMAPAKISRADIAAILAEMTEKSGPVAANRARSALSGFFAWAMGEGICENNPVIGTNKRKENGPRERSLSDAEAASVWLAARDNDYGHILKLILLTGCRRGELGGLSSDARHHSQLGSVLLPSVRVKVRAQVCVRLSARMR